MEENGGNTSTMATFDVAGVQDQAAPAQRVRDLVAETEIRGAPMISSQALQRRLFEVYDAASAVPEALALVQHNLGLTLDRTWYSAAEIEGLADQIDWLLASASLQTIDVVALDEEAAADIDESSGTKPS